MLRKPKTAEYKLTHHDIILLAIPTILFFGPVGASIGGIGSQVGILISGVISAIITVVGLFTIPIK